MIYYSALVINMDQVLKYQIIVVALILSNLGIYYMLYQNNITSSEEISQLNFDITGFKDQIKDLEEENYIQKSTIITQNENMVDLWNQLFINDIIILENNGTIKLKNNIIVEYVNNLVQELYKSAEDKIYYIIEINNLEARIVELESELNATT